MNKSEMVHCAATNLREAFSRWRRGVRLVVDPETQLTVEVPRDLNESDASDFASSAAFTQLVQREIHEKGSTLPLEN